MKAAYRLLNEVMCNQLLPFKTVCLGDTQGKPLNGSVNFFVLTMPSLLPETHGTSRSGNG